MRKQLFLLFLISSLSLQAMSTDGSESESTSSSASVEDGLLKKSDPTPQRWSRRKKAAVFALAAGTATVFASIYSPLLDARTDNDPIESFSANVPCDGRSVFGVQSICYCEQQPCRCIITSCGEVPPTALDFIDQFTKIFGICLGTAATTLYAKFGPN